MLNHIKKSSVFLLVSIISSLMLSQSRFESINSINYIPYDYLLSQIDESILNSNDDYKLPYDIKLNIYDVEIILKKDTYFSKDKKYLQELCNINTTFLTELNSIEITTQNLDEILPNVDTSKYGTEVSISGFASFHDVTVNCDIDDGGTLIHELAHVYDSFHGTNGKPLSTSDEFLEIYEEEKDYFGKESYRMVNSGEYFAAATEFFFYNNEYLAEQAPCTYWFLFEHIAYLEDNNERVFTPRILSSV